MAQATRSTCDEIELGPGSTTIETASTTSTPLNANAVSFIPIPRIKLQRCWFVPVARGSTLLARQDSKGD